MASIPVNALATIGVYHTLHNDVTFYADDGGGALGLSSTSGDGIGPEMESLRCGSFV